MTNQNQKKSPEEKIIEIGYKNNVFNFLTEVERENFLKCVKIIGKYNDFDYDLIKENFNLVNLNYTDNKSLFHYKIGREFSPVIYVIYNKLFNYYFDDNKKLKEMSKNDFKNLMLNFKKKIKADEISFEENEFYINCRFWWG